jgi:hypothetical protein
MRDVSELPVLAEAGWSRDEEPPPVPGFVVSGFSPVVAELANRCLTDRHGSAPAPEEIGRRTGVVLVTASGDVANATHVATTVDSGQRVGPLLFFQSVPNSVIGHLATKWGLGGPVVCVGPPGSPREAGLAQARLLIEDEDADEVLVLLVEQAGDRPEGSAFLVRGGKTR